MDERVLYHTYTMRPRVAIGKGRFEWIPAAVVARRGCAWLRILPDATAAASSSTASAAAAASSFPTADDRLYCSDLAFFERMLRMGGTARLGFPAHAAVRALPPPPTTTTTMPRAGLAAAAAAAPASVGTSACSARRKRPPRRFGGAASLRRHPPRAALLAGETALLAASSPLRLAGGAAPAAARAASATTSAAAIEAAGAAFARDDLKHPHVPLMVALHLYRNGRFVSDAQLRREVAQLTAHYPDGCRFVVRLVAGLATDPAILNAKVRLVDELLEATCPIWLEASFERLLHLCALDDSALLRPRVFPAISVYLAPGVEESAEVQIANLVDALREYRGVQLIVILSVDRPGDGGVELPALRSILASLRAASTIVRLVMFKLERSPASMLASIRQKKPQPQQASAAASAPPASLRTSNDPMPLLRAIEAATDGEIKPSDLLPMSVGRIVEPMLPLMGYGRFCVRPSPWGTFFTPLVTTPGGLRSTPLTRLLDVEQLYHALMPAATAPTPTQRVLRMLPKLRGAVRRSLQPGADEHLPGLLALAVGSAASKKKARAIIKNMQIIVVHNAMDYTAMDYVRRCRCSMQSLAGAAPQGLRRRRRGDEVAPPLLTAMSTGGLL